jgi:hypothetical protein
MKIAKWFVELAQIICEVIQTCLSYILGRERQKREQAEQALKLQKIYEKLDAENKNYRDHGQSGLLERLRKIRNSEGK